MLDNNIIIISCLVSVIFICFVILKNKYVMKENNKLKSIVCDSIIVFILSILSFYTYVYLNKKKIVPAFTDKPKF